MKTPAHTLVRVRNNQRRHRERRRQYVATLEQKVQETERLLVQATADIAALEAELRNRTCDRCRLHKHKDGEVSGSMPPCRAVTPETLSQASQTDDSADACPISTATPNALAATFNPLDQYPATSVVQAPHSCCKRCGYNARCSSPCSIEVDFATTKPSTQSPVFKNIGAQLLPAPSQSLESVHSESTTLCTDAFFLLEQHNFRGLSPHEITVWLFRGFRPAKNDGEGCRVENQLLFELLDFVSSN